ncbi:heme ABC transporter ATP-binding protein [Solibacillus sp. R5-41]|uniref:ABC transporter ATP-binding protein n=1 Tax=Solibacillus sp. R5-41 TaxID=2048654 RepID=UPI000C1299BD|nr:ABC transporter ATP-binding protein [Solibacillus sp. R5-41]ATP38858.1 heme ABC transporter ATP-binding protein [Solibacillus sp. R5-41]
MQPIIHFENFTFQYDSQQKPTLQNIDLTIYEGEKICIVGPSGSGKSTLAHCLNGLIPERYNGKYTGKLDIIGKPATSFSLFEQSKKIGTVLQDTDSQFIGLTVAEDIAFALENDMIPQQQMKEMVMHAAKQVEIEAHLQHQIFELSGGQKQRTAMAGVLVNDVDILLFDEPLANLDPATGKSAMALIERLHEETQKTIILVEHRLEDVLSQPIDRIILINNGEIIADLSPAKLLQTNLLAENDIREPLYIRLLKYAGVDISTLNHLDTLQQLDIEAYQTEISNWLQLESKQSLAQPNYEEVLRLQDVTFTYSKAKKPTLRNIDFSVQAGEFISIVGTNGAGKSTLAKCICGFEKVKQGKVLINGADAKKDSLKLRAEKVGFVLQNPNQMFSQPKIFDEVAFGLRQRNVDEAEIEVSVLKILKVCGLYPFRNWPISALSYGQKRRVAIAAILVLNPSIIILDEPTAGQDYKHAKELMEFLQSLTKNGTTVIVITHDMHLMSEYTNRTIVVHDGQLIADKKPSQVLTNLSLVAQANLKESSLFTVATRLGLTEPFELVECFIQYERRVLTNG